MPSRRLLCALAALLLLVPVAPAEEPPVEFLSRRAVGAERFTAEHPAWDGRGVLIAILDTGLDVAARGLAETSEGKPKILDVQDFSGEGDLKLEKAEVSTEAGEQRLVHAASKRYLKNADRLSEKAKGGEYWIGWLDESRFAGSGVKDVNGNGREEDSFGFAAFPVEGSEAWAAVADTDLDGDLGDEQVLHDFKTARATFRFATGKAEATPPGLVLALNLRPADHVISLFFDDGGHGTHVAGIATGRRLGDAEGVDGIAPGAQVIGLKIGHCAKAGISTSGSMRRAFEYGAQVARERGMPLVFNLSYGIGSEIEGRAEIDRWLDGFLAEHEDLVACISAGNDGPGISSAGTPGAAALALTAGALLDRATARALFGSDPGEDRIHIFSSRGGELPKPDLATPGSASSATPHWGRWDVASGTSMAAPQLAGCVALLLSAARASGLTGIGHRAVRRALLATARPLPGYAPVDQGAGVVDVPAAWTALARRAGLASAPAPVAAPAAADVSTPAGPGSPSPAAAGEGRGGGT
ncbi:MAG: S8 family serine peptidase, partial [Planctomycetes bacterium]|nr:S8 family serine peptidase [Planctomycetota bacterium]